LPVPRILLEDDNMCKRRTVPVSSILAIALFMILPTNHLWARTWTSKDGVFSVKADFVDLIDDTVSLLKENGRIAKVPLKALSDSDQKVARAIMSARNVKVPITKPDGKHEEKEVTSTKDPRGKTAIAENKSKLVPPKLATDTKGIKEFRQKFQQMFPKPKWWDRIQIEDAKVRSPAELLRASHKYHKISPDTKFKVAYIALLEYPFDEEMVTLAIIMMNSRSYPKNMELLEFGLSNYFDYNFTLSGKSGDWTAVKTRDLSQIYIRQKRYDEAISIIEKLFSQRKDEINDHTLELTSIEYATALFKTKRKAEAISVLEKAIEEYEGSWEKQLKKKLSEIKNAPESGSNENNPQRLAIRKPPKRDPKKPDNKISTKRKAKIKWKVGSTAIKRELATKSRFAFKGTPLFEVVAYLSKKHSIPTRIDYRSLSDAGFELDTPVTAKADGKSLRVSLNNMLDPLDLAWIIRDDVLVITTRMVMGEFLTTRVYKPRGSVNFNVLVRDITSKIAPSSWVDAGGLGSIAPLSLGVVIISQNDRVHHQIEERYGKLIRPVSPGKQIPGRNVVARALVKTTEFNFNPLPLKEVVDQISKKHKVDISIDVKALDKKGISIDVPVNFKIQGVSLQSALKLLLYSISSSLTYLPSSDKILITTHQTTFKVQYRVNDLLQQNNYNELILAITANIANTTWEDIGGIGSIGADPRSGSLIVKQTYPVHQKISQFLADLRQAKKGR